MIARQATFSQLMLPRFAKLRFLSGCSRYTCKLADTQGFASEVGHRLTYWKYSCAGETILSRVSSSEQFS